MSALADYIRARVAGCVSHALDEMRRALDGAEQRAGRHSFNEHPRLAVEALGRGLQAATMSLGSALEELHGERVALIARGTRLAEAAEAYMEAVRADPAGPAAALEAALEQWRELVP